MINCVLNRAIYASMVSTEADEYNCERFGDTICVRFFLKQKGQHIHSQLSAINCVSISMIAIEISVSKVIIVGGPNFDSDLISIGQLFLSADFLGWRRCWQYFHHRRSALWFLHWGDYRPLNASWCDVHAYYSLPTLFYAILASAFLKNFQGLQNRSTLIMLQFAIISHAAVTFPFYSE